MPTTEQILAHLEHAANAWWPLAVFWHVYFGAAAAALAFGVRLSSRACGTLLALPFLSVSAVAWASGNPFNGIAYSVLGIALAAMAAGLSRDPPRPAPLWASVPGALMFVLGWTYPHFLRTSSWLAYVYAAPTGVIPCPTLLIVIGLALILNGLGSRRWSLTLGLWGAFYGITGPLWLGVAIDWFLAAGAGALVALAIVGNREARPLPPAPAEVT